MSNYWQPNEIFRVIFFFFLLIKALVAIYGCARIGAIHSVVFGGFASMELARRIDDAKVRIMHFSEVSAGIYFFKVSNRNNRTMWEICSKLTIKKTELHLIFPWKHQKTSVFLMFEREYMTSLWCFFFVNFEQISHIDLLFLLLTWNK